MAGALVSPRAGTLQRGATYAPRSRPRSRSVTMRICSACTWATDAYPRPSEPTRFDSHWIRAIPESFAHAPTRWKLWCRQNERGAAIALARNAWTSRCTGITGHAFFRSMAQDGSTSAGSCWLDGSKTSFAFTGNHFFAGSFTAMAAGSLQTTAVFPAFATTFQTGPKTSRSSTVGLLMLSAFSGRGHVLSRLLCIARRP